MAITIAIAADKGGTGKTTTTYALAVALAKSGHNVIAFDFDPQANLTKVMLGRRGNDLTDTLTTALRNGTILPTIKANLASVVPADINLSMIDEDLNVPLTEALRNMLKPALSKADFVLIDCPPGASNKLAYSAVSLSDYVILPVTADGLCVDAIDDMLSLIHTIPSVKLLGILITQQRYNGGNIYLAMEKMMRERYGQMVFKQTIRHCAKLKEKLTFGYSLLPAYTPYFYDKASVALYEKTVNKDRCCISELDYISLAAEILDKFNLHLNINYNIK